MSKEEKIEILFGKCASDAEGELPLMAHWNNDSGCRI